MVYKLSKNYKGTAGLDVEYIMKFSTSVEVNAIVLTTYRDGDAIRSERMSIDAAREKWQDLFTCGYKEISS